MAIKSQKNSKSNTKKKRQKPGQPKLSHLRKPADMTTVEWQKALRAQAARDEKLPVIPVDKGQEGYFTVLSPLHNKRYSVVFRGRGSEWNYCSCLDFKTNHLGTCKHIEAVAEYKNGYFSRRRYELPFRSTVYLDYRGERTVRLRVNGTDSLKIKSIARDYFDDELRLKEDRFLFFEEFISRVEAEDLNLKCYDDAMEFILEKRERIERAKIADKDGHRLFDGLLKVRLYPYQREGAEFAFRNGRTIIADDMGLGKTIQAIATAMLLRKYGFNEDVWIVCPTSLKYQWESEIKKFTGEEACVIEGSIIDRNAQLQNPESYFKIISYNSLVNNIKYGLKKWPGLVIYDEVQRLKNWDTKMAVAMRNLKSDYVVALSGTPLENRLTELYSVMQLVDQFALGPYWQFVEDTTDLDDTGRVIGYHNLNEVGNKLKPFLVRRLKRDVKLQMPARTDKTLFVPMTKEQKAIHDDCKFNVGILIQRWRKFKFLSEKDRMRLMLLLSTMRMVADSTFILDQVSRHDTKIDEAIQIVSDLIESGDEKVVIFSQWERMQRIMAQELDKKGIGFRFLHGGVPSQKRGELISDFQNDSECRVFLSTDAGSTGLNLQSASVVINFDLPWNPAVLEQRIARVYRLGQQRHVQVINMVSKDTIEERMLDTLAFKTGIFEGVLDGGEDSIVLNEKKFDRIVEIVDETFSSGDKNQEEEEPTVEPVPEKEPESSEKPLNEPAKESSNVPSAESAKEPVEEPSNAPAHEKIIGWNDNPDSRPDNIVTQTIEVLGNLAKAISTPESRKAIVDSIVKEDPETGQKTISIPIKDEATVDNVLTLMAGLFSSFKK